MGWKVQRPQVLLVWVSMLAGGISSAAQNSQVEATFERGAKAMRSGQTSAAEEAFRDAVRLAPQMAEAHLDLGLVLGREGKTDEAIASLKKALELNPDAMSAHMFLGIFLYQNHQAEEAMKELQKELTTHPDNAEALSWLGTVELGIGDAAHAAAAFDRAYELSPDDLNVLEFRGRAHNMVAKDSYSRLARLAPGSWHVHRVQAELYAEEGKHADAANEFQAAIKSQPNNPDLYENLGDEYRSMSQLEAAASAYRKGLELGPANPIAMYNLGSTEVEMGNSTSGVPLLLSMNKAYPGSPVAEYYLGRGLSSLGKDEEAIEWLKKSASGASSGEAAKRSYYELTRLYRKMHRPDQERAAMAEYNRLRIADEKKGSEQIQDWKKLDQSTGISGAPPVVRQHP